VAGRPHAPAGADWDAAVERWRRLPTDEGASYARSITLDASRLEPMVTYGTNPGMGFGIRSRVPDPDRLPDLAQRNALRHSLEYMGLAPGEPILDRPIDVVFIGSCTNSRIGDLRAAARVARDRGSTVDPLV
jgi:3-isopropylmalate/(R)-2-methylmalate dehydratase large subunit